MFLRKLTEPWVVGWGKKAILLILKMLFDIYTFSELTELIFSPPNYPMQC